MKRSREAAKIVREIRSRLAEIPIANTPAVRNVRRDVSRQISNQSPEVVMQTAMLLLNEETGPLRVVAYELISHHQQTFEILNVDSLLKLGAGINSWSSVDCFGMILFGPTWLHGRIPDEAIYSWVRSKDLWWRRAALVSTVALVEGADLPRTSTESLRSVRDCRGITKTLVVKALSWALRELSKKHPEQTRRFVVKHKKVLAARVIREVENKLTTGRKTPKK